MSNVTTAAAVNRFASVRFTDPYGDASTWEYEIPRWVSGISEGIPVVCDFNGDLKIGEVVDVRAGAEHRAHCKIVCAIPIEEHRALVRAEDDRRAMMARMAERKEELDALSDYRALKDDPEMAALLATFLGGEAAAAGNPDAD